MKRPRRRPTFMTLLFMASFVLGFEHTVHAVPSVPVFIDQHTIIRNGTQVFQDNFDDGVPPPDFSGSSRTSRRERWTRSEIVVNTTVLPFHNRKLRSRGKTFERPRTFTILH